MRGAVADREREHVERKARELHPDASEIKVLWSNGTPYAEVWHGPRGSRGGGTARTVFP